MFSLASFAQSVNYKLSMPKPQNHYFHVEMMLQDFEGDEISVEMPVWAPGSYLVREFPKNVNIVKAFDQAGKPLPVKKTRKNVWKITKGNAKNIKVKYEVYSFELTVRTSFLDLTHGYLNGTSIFMYVPEYKELSGNLEIVPHANFAKISTALPQAADGVTTDDRSSVFTFDNYDHLADCPIEIGNQETFDFMASGVKHRVAMYGTGNYNIERLKEDMTKVIESATNVFGENPNKDYLFIIHNTLNGGGGLEHTNSTTLNVNRFTYEGSDYIGFLSLVAHEYFHLWNVKRIRPMELGPFDYSNENYTSLLWVMEGFTSYYDELLLRRSGFYTEEQYASRVMSTLNYVEGTPGNKVQPVAHASFDAWIKSYRPNENSRNTTISYYPKGHVIAVVFDAMIIEKYKGKKSLDDFMQLIYKKYYKKMNRGFTEEEFQSEMEDFLKTDLDDFFNNHIYGAETIDYKKYLSKIGMDLTDVSETTPTFGVTTANEGGKLIVKGISAEGAAEESGLSVNDEIIAVNGYRVNSANFSSFLSGLRDGDEMSLIISRDELLMVLDAKMGEATRTKFTFELNDDNKYKEYWLRKD